VVQLDGGNSTVPADFIREPFETWKMVVSPDPELAWESLADSLDVSGALLFHGDFPKSDTK
jgi:hypothetical protein